jgi:hypothetical protein
MFTCTLQHPEEQGPKNAAQSIAEAIRFTNATD